MQHFSNARVTSTDKAFGSIGDYQAVARRYIAHVERFILFLRHSQPEEYSNVDMLKRRGHP